MTGTGMNQPTRGGGGQEERPAKGSRDGRPSRPAYSTGRAVGPPSVMSCSTGGRLQNPSLPAGR